MILFEILRKINRHVKRQKKIRAGRYLSPVRRIERVYPLKGERVCAMTFDDGPSALPPSPPVEKSEEKGLTEVLMDTLDRHEAVGTFDCVGSTHENYPDKRGKLHTAKWGGTAHDHYPDFERDHMAGIINQPELGSKILARGHEMANHGGRHVIFGPMKLIYDSREALKDLPDVLSDLTLFHNFAYDTFGKSPTFSRPPHYIDGIRGRYSAYDAYAHMGYQYMAASFDGGGWKPSKGNYEEDVNLMVTPMEKALSENPNSLNGQIIFQKDGFNMSLQTPIAHALERQLELLKSNGYRVIGVDALVSMSPFEDYGEGHENFEMARDLVNAGFIVAYQNNSFQPDRLLTFGELVTMTTPKDLHVALSKLEGFPLRSDFDYEAWDLERIQEAKVMLRRSHPYFWHFKYAVSKGYLSEIRSDWDVDDKVNPMLLKAYLTGVIRGYAQTAFEENQVRACELLLEKLEGRKEAQMTREEVLPFLYETLKSVNLL